MFRNFLILIVVFLFASACSPDHRTPESEKSDLSGGNSKTVVNEGTSGTRGGGDPDAVEFLVLADHIGQWMIQDQQFSGPESLKLALKFNEMVKHLQERMEDPTNPSIRFTDEPLTDDSGTSKIGIFNRETMVITVNRVGWYNCDKKKQYTVVALEIWGLIGEGERYEEVGRMISENFGDIVDIGISMGTYESVEAAFSMRFMGMFSSEVSSEELLPQTHVMYLHEQRKLVGRFRKALDIYHSLPLQYRFDTFVSGNYLFKVVGDDGVSIRMQNVDGRFPPPTFLAFSLKVNLKRLADSLTVLGYTDLLDEAGKEKLREILIEVQRYQNFFEGFGEPFSEVSEIGFPRTSYSIYLNAVQIEYRKLVVRGGCEYLASFTPLGMSRTIRERYLGALQVADADLDNLYEQSLVNQTTWESISREISIDVKNLILAYNLSDSQNNDPDTPYLISGINGVSRLIYELTVEVAAVNEEFKKLTLEPIRRAWEEGYLCLK